MEYMQPGILHDRASQPVMVLFPQTIGPPDSFMFDWRLGVTSLIVCIAGAMSASVGVGGYVLYRTARLLYYVIPPGCDTSRSLHRNTVASKFLSIVTIKIDLLPLGHALSPNLYDANRTLLVLATV